MCRGKRKRKLLHLPSTWSLNKRKAKVLPRRKAASLTICACLLKQMDRQCSVGQVMDIYTSEEVCLDQPDLHPQLD